uniref:CDGSH iron-sulfur domain-containing protein 2 homologue n=1 Tax=Lynceus sp. MCZ IZ 141354 TaxID=1930659 RepID=A0A9N6WRT3_9CRUS|nr:EOG090X0JRY [Lynceus sp. MCZ IZ 141354]
MNALSELVRVSLPNYLASLPIPDHITGWFHLSLKDWLYMVPFGAAIAGVSYLTYDKVSSLQAGKNQRMNCVVKLNEAKVVDTINIEDLDKSVYLCRCWKSKKFPYCDGSHNKHNEETGDNVGPAGIIKKAV